MSGAELVKALRESGTGAQKLEECREVLRMNPKCSAHDIVGEMLTNVMRRSGVAEAEISENLTARMTNRKAAFYEAWSGLKRSGVTNGTLEKAMALAETGLLPAAPTAEPLLEDQILAETTGLTKPAK